MTVPITIRGVTVQYPTEGDLAWGNNATQFATLTGSAVAPINGLYNTTTGNVGSIALSNTNVLTLSVNAGPPIVIGTGSISGSDGQVLTSNGAGNAVPLPYGTTGQVLTSAGAGFAPAYVNQNTIQAGNGVLVYVTNPLTGTLGQVIYNSTDGLLYRYDGAVWVSTLPTAQLTGLVQTLQINDGAIIAAKTALAGINNITGNIANNAVDVANLVNGAVTDVKIASAAVTAVKLNVAAISSVTGDLNTGVVNNSNVVNGAIDAVKLASAAVTASKTSLASIDNTTGNLTANSVTAVNITAGSVIAGKLAVDAVVAVNIAAGAVVAGKIAANTISATELQANSVIAGKINANAVTAVTIGAGEVVAGKLSTDSVVAANIQAGNITAVKMAVDSVAAANIIAGNVTAGKLSTDSVVTNNIVAGNVTGLKIAANTITASNIFAGTITSNEIAANTIQANNILSGTITSNKIAAGTILATNIATGTITAASGVIGSLDANTITTGAIRGINIQSGAFISTGSYLAIATVGGDATITLGNTIDFPASGSGLVTGDTVNNNDTFTYTGKSSTTLTGCSGVLAHTVNAIVAPYSGSTSAIIGISAVDNSISASGNLTGAVLSPTARINPRGNANYEGDFAFISGGSSLSTSNHGVIGYTAGSTYSGVAGRASNAGAYGVSGTNTLGYGVYGNTVATGYAGVRANGYTGIETSASGAGPCVYMQPNSTGPHQYFAPLAARPTGGFAISGSVAMCFTTGGGVGTRTGTPRLVFHDGANWLFVADNSVFSG